MTEDQSRTEQSSKDRIVKDVADQVVQRPSVDASREEIEARAEKAVDALVDKPVQTFTALLVENEVVGGLMSQKHEQRAQDDEH